jgi:pentatricopeptide repeat protein
VKWGSLGDAQNLFDEMGGRDLCSWNTMISGYAKMGKLGESRKLFDEMPKRIIFLGLLRSLSIHIELFIFNIYLKF